MANITQTFSQLLLTYGPGAMLDLPDNAVVVSGLQDWQYGPGWRPVEEERLVALLKQQLGTKLSPTFIGLRQPPYFDEDRKDNRAPGVEVRIFPAWFTVDESTSSAEQGETVQTNEKRRRIVEFTDLNINASGKLSYPGASRKTEVNPVRFVGACSKGHLQDIDWRNIAHRNGDRSCRKTLFWSERGVSSDPSDISVKCSCGASVTLAEMYRPNFLGGCECKSPWLRPIKDAGEECKENLHLLPRSATNTYFPQTVTMISLVKTDNPVRQAIADHKSTIDSIRSLTNFIEFLRLNPQTKAAFENFSDEEIFKALEESDVDVAQAAPNPRIAEFDMLSSGVARIGNDKAGSYLFAETLKQDEITLVSPWDRFLKNIVKVHRLREVICLYGFTRLEPPPSATECEMDEIQLAVDGAALSRNIEWLPALEQYGEGIFLHVSSEYINQWLSSPETRKIAEQLREREKLDAQRFHREPRHLGIAYWALHSLSHAVMSELALECGYPLSSLKERIYASSYNQADRFGVLIYTSSVGGQGTLGGLSIMAHQMDGILARAANKLKLCSNDPICSDHSHGNADYPLQGAACHACLLVPETSCELRNTRLDRDLLVQTVLGSGSPLFPDL